MGPAGLKGDTGIKGQKGDRGSTGMPGTKGQPGQSISFPAVVVSPVTLTVNEGGSASFQCSASGNPEPAIVCQTGQSVRNHSISGFRWKVSVKARDRK